MRTLLPLGLAVLAAVVTAGCGSGSSRKPVPPPIVVNSLLDLADPPEGTVTLRSALAQAADGQAVTFDQNLDGGTIALSIVAEEHTVLKGEVMGMRNEPSGPVSYLVGYFERDYGRSALYARKSVAIDASNLPAGLTIAWTGGRSDPARVLAVYGNLAMANVTVTGGYSVTENIATGDPDDQPWTLARGGGLAVWGLARLTDCTLFDNHCEGDFDSSRDRGAFGGGLYADLVVLEDCVVSGNTVLGGGAAGGGVYAVCGAAWETAVESVVSRCSVTGNRISALFTYGAGVYSDGGGIGKANTLLIENSTIARNLAEPAPGMPPFLLAMGYWRGGGVYISNGRLTIRASTIVENEVHGVPRQDDLSRQNLAGGVAATVGNAHAVEEMSIGQSIIAGNMVRELGPGGVPSASYGHDVFTGSLMYFRSLGHNRIGVLDMSQILVPVGEKDWASLSRRHWPMEDDEAGVAVASVLNLASGITHSPLITSRGVDDQDPAVLSYQPAGTAIDRVPTGPWVVDEIYAEYELAQNATDDFLAIVLGRIETHYGLPGFAAAFTVAFENYLTTVDVDEDAAGVQPHLDPAGNPIFTLADTHWFGPAVTWPKEVYNRAYIEFWHRLDAALTAESLSGMGPETLGDKAWADLFSSGPLAENPGIDFSLGVIPRMAAPTFVDQISNSRPGGFLSDIGAIEGP